MGRGQSGVSGTVVPYLVEEEINIGTVLVTTLNHNTEVNTALLTDQKIQKHKDVTKIPVQVSIKNKMALEVSKHKLYLKSILSLESYSIHIRLCNNKT